MDIENLNYEICKLSWSKRRPLDEEKEIISIKINDFKREENHFCKMEIEYPEGLKKLTGRINFNEIKGYWFINGINGQGDQCLIKIKDN